VCQRAGKFALVFVDAVKHSPGMAPASRFHNAPVVKHTVVATERVRLQEALEVSKGAPGVFAFAVRRVLKPHGRRRRVNAGVIIADVHPRPTGLGLAPATSQHTDRRVVAMNLGAVQNIPVHGLRQWREQPGSITDDVALGRHGHLDAVAAF
jgi:hypothetical protein